jgi:hypothetical protein
MPAHRSPRSRMRRASRDSRVWWRRRRTARCPRPLVPAKIEVAGRPEAIVKAREAGLGR